MHTQVEINIITVKDAAYNDVWNLREEVLRKPLGLSLKNEDLSRDILNTIFSATIDNKIIGCVFLQPITENEIQLRAMAVYSDWQQHNIGKALVAAAEKYAINNGYRLIVLHARKVAMGFYEKMGYIHYGDEFIEVGIPHFMMKKDLLK